MKKTILALLLLGSSHINATDRYVDVAGSDSSDCSSSPCLTLQYAIDQSVDGDNIYVAPGFYSVAGLATINKSLKLFGAQAGVDARSRSGAESVLSNSQGLSVASSYVIVDGFTIQDSNVAAFTGYGMWLNPGISGTQVVNNIFTNNIVGLGLANQGDEALIEHNYFVGNNQSGAASGTGIYSDQYVSGPLSNVRINENTFESNQNAGIAFASEDAANPATNIYISNNAINNCGRGVYLFNVSYSALDNNTISNLSIPTDGGSSVAIGIYGGVNNVSALFNTLEYGAQYGLRIGNLSGVLPANGNLSIHSNNIFGFAQAGMHVENAVDGFVEFATCNYWGASTGPTSLLNPSGTGDYVTGEVILENFNPWLDNNAPFGTCGVIPPATPISLAKVFAPSLIYKGEKTTMVITLSNSSDNDAVLTAPLLDILPFGLEIKGHASTTCDGEVIAQKNGRTLILADGVIPHNGFCNITVTVKGLNQGEYTNTLPANSLQTDQGNNPNEATANLIVAKKNHNGL